MARKRNRAGQEHNFDTSVEEHCTDAAIVEPGDDPFFANGDEYIEDDEHVAEQVEEKRKTPRAYVDQEATVQFHVTPDEIWKEETRLMTVSKSGASFALTRQCDVGCLVELVMPMPAELRAHDFTDELYSVIGLVQYCCADQSDDELQTYSVGVAFVGKCFPDGHEANPTQNYHISGTTESGMWQIRPSGSAFKIRAAPRFWTPVAVTITQLKRDRSQDHKEQTVTNNVSASGASVPCRLNVDIGDRIKFASKEHNFYSFGIIRNRQVEPGKIPVLHIEFVDHRFPVEKIAVPRVTAVTA